MTSRQRLDKNCKNTDSLHEFSGVFALVPCESREQLVLTFG